MTFIPIFYGYKKLRRLEVSQTKILLQFFFYLYPSPEFSSKLSRLKEWLTPLKSLSSYTHEGLPALVEQVKALKDDVTKLPRGLITVLRILRHLAITPVNNYPEGKYSQTCVKQPPKGSTKNGSLGQVAA